MASQGVQRGAGPGQPSQPGQPGLQGRAQQTPPRPNGLILGRVVDATTGKPVGGAMVYLTGGTPIPRTTGAARGAGPIPGTPSQPPNTPPAGLAQRTPMLTAGDGRFLYYGLTRGSYTISVNASGFAGGNYGQRKPSGPYQPLDLADGQRIGDVTIKLWRYGAIEGTITDEAGEPLVNGTVRLMRRTVTGTRVRFVGGPTARTDDRGMFRVGTLTPGEYVVAVPSTQTTMPVSVIDAYQQAMAAGGSAAQDFSRRLQASNAPSPNVTGIQVGQSRLQTTSGTTQAMLSASGDRVFVYRTAYYPVAHTIGDATAIKVDSGEERTGIDLQVRPVPTSRVSGTVVGPQGPAVSLGLRLLLTGVDQSASDVGFEVATTVTDAEGAFMFLGVPEGQYSLRALMIPESVGRGMPPPPPPPSGRGGVQVVSARPPAPVEPILWGRMPVTVGQEDVSGLALTMRAGLRVSGRLQFDGTAPLPPANRLQQVTISLSPLQSMNAPLQPGRVDADGQFTLENIVPGKYLINGVSINQWNMKAAMVNGRDVSETGLELDNDIDGLVITLTDRQSSISGTVGEGLRPAAASIQVVLFPADLRSWMEGGMSSRRMRSTRLNPSATFGATYTFGNVPPGDYLVLALAEDDADDWPDPQFIEEIARFGQRVSVGEGEKKMLDLTLSKIK